MTHFAGDLDVVDRVGIGEIHRNLLEMRISITELHHKMDEVRETQAGFRSEQKDLRERLREVEARQWQAKVGLGLSLAGVGALVKVFLP